MNLKLTFDDKSVEALIGKFNDLPPNMEEVSPNDLWRSLHLYQPLYWCNRSPRVADTSPDAPNVPEDLSIIITSGTPTTYCEGFAVETVYDGGHRDPKTKEWIRGTGEFKLGRIWHFTSCKHTWIPGPNDGRWRCYHESKCTKCGYLNVVDSSD